MAGRLKLLPRNAAATCASGFRDERGFTTFGVVLALLITLSLLFTAAQVQRVYSLSAEVQDVADAAALAAQNEVAEFMIVVRVCDAVVLSLTLTGLASIGLGVAALCTPFTAPASSGLLKAGQSILKARDSFSDKAQAGLSRLQAALPFLSAANAAFVAQANSEEGDSSYVALAVPVPWQADAIAIGEFEGAQSLADSAIEQASDIEEAAQQAEELANEANAYKEEAFRHDCGNNPDYCMYERAETLAGMQGSDNPLYRSVDSWSFEVALNRARAYYERRAAVEQPVNASVAEQASSALRKRFYHYASKELQKGYVREDESGFDANFPRLPRNTDEMKRTALYDEEVYPVTLSGESRQMHAWEGCPNASGSTALGSCRQLDGGGFETCPLCEFTSASLGKVAQASTAIENGFEYHYDKVALAALKYEGARASLDPVVEEVKTKAGGLLEQCGSLLKEAASFRIDVNPPGGFGSVVVAVNTSSTLAAGGFASSFVGSSASLGPRIAISSATLIEDEADDQGNVVTSLLDNVDAGVVSGLAGVALDVWSGLLSAYAKGQDALSSTVSKALDALPFSGASGLGSWASGALEEAVASVGLESANLNALKPVVVNSAHVLQKDSSQLSAELVAVKRQAVQGASSFNGFSFISGAAESVLQERLEGLSDGFEVAEVEIFPGGPSFTIRIALPEAVSAGAGGLVDQAMGFLDTLRASITGVRSWE